MTSDLRNVAALCQMLPSMEGSAVELFVEDLLSRLRLDVPGAAQICGALLRAMGSELGRGLGQSLLDELGEFDGGSLYPQSGKIVDVLILTIKPIELDAVLAAFEVADSVQPALLNETGLCAWIFERDGFRFAVSMVGAAGNVETAVVLGSLREVLDARMSVLVGMAAGVRGTVNLGDVVVADTVWAYEFARMRPEGALYEPRPYSVREAGVRNVRLWHKRLPNWAGSVAAGVEQHIELDLWPEDEDERVDTWKPSVVRGGILAGGRLVEDSGLPEFASEIHGRAVAAEMEGAGFAAACDEAGWPWWVIRGIADYGEVMRRKHWQFPATYAAADFLRQALFDGLITLE